MTAALAALLEDGPWRISKTSDGELWLVSASGLPLAKVKQEEAAGVMCAGAELHRLAGAVEQLVQAARRVTAIRLRFPTDSHLTPAWAELAVALKPFPVAGGAGVSRQDAPAATEAGGEHPHVHPADRGPSDTPAALATHNPPHDDAPPEGWQASVSGGAYVGAGRTAEPGRSGGAATPLVSDPLCARPGCGHRQRFHTCWGECHVERYVDDAEECTCREFVEPGAVVPEGSSGTPGNPASASALSSFSTTGAEGPSGAAVPQADGHADAPEGLLDKLAAEVLGPQAIYAGSTPADPMGRDGYTSYPHETIEETERRHFLRSQQISYGGRR